MRYSSKFLGSRVLSARSGTANQAFRAPPREDAISAQNRRPARTLMMKPDLFSCRRMARERTSYHAIDAKLTTKQALGEAARVRRDAHRA